jgi:hypothetical protein
MACLCAALLFGLIPAPPEDTSRLGGMIFLLMLATWWSAPLIATAACMRTLSFGTIATISGQAVALLAEAGIVVEVIFFEPPDGQSALIVLPAPVFGAAAGGAFVIIVIVARRRHARRSHVQAALQRVQFNS